MNQVKSSKVSTPSLLSCEECRRRKRKCSKEKPVCSMCFKNQTSCEYKRPRKRGPPKGYMLGMRSTSFIFNQKPTTERKVRLLKSSPESEVKYRTPVLNLFSLSAPSIALPKIPPALQTELLRTFIRHFGYSAPIFHHEYLFYRLSKQALPDFLLQCMFAIGSRFILKNQQAGIANSNIPSKWVDIILETDFTGNALQLAQQQVFMEPNIYNAIALSFLSMMLYYDGSDSAASTCLMLAAKIVQDSGLALLDVEYDGSGNSTIENIEKEEHRRLFWCLLILDRWVQQRSMVAEEKTACILPPSDELKWQQLTLHLPNTPTRISYEDRKMWSFMIEIEFLHSDISCLLNNIEGSDKIPTLFGKVYYSDHVPDASTRLEQYKRALLSWKSHLPSEYRYVATADENEPGNIQLNIPKWMQIIYLVNKLHLHQIEMTLCCHKTDVSLLRDCLETGKFFLAHVIHDIRLTLSIDPIKPQSL
ncbi:hypothetical protein K7432_011452 [Basidiobolus ranarum]|uniref:Zn(2)-C6 fungal-type domain-containing protein n=1 Tax=Basidiobolus ranarum TaxID=34480 RepID=A0ABR2WM92_9FUNG